MSNIVSDNLHRLIKSMTKAEKRYFRIFSARHILGDENNYRILFNAIDQQEEYNEDKILRKFKDRQFINRFSISKNRLYNAILKSLDSFHSNSSVEAQLTRQIHTAEILYHKSLYDQSLKLLHSARKTATKHEKHSVLVSIGNWEKRIIEKDNYGTIGVEEISSMLKADHSLQNELNVFNELWNIKSRIFHSLFSQGKVRSTLEEEQFRKIMDEVAMKLRPDELSASNRYMWNHIHSAYYFAVGSYDECYPYLKENLELIEKNAHLFEEEPNIYLSVLSNAIYVGMRLSKWKEAESYLEKLRKFPEAIESNANIDLSARVFVTLYSTELTLCVHSGEFKRGVEIIPNVEKGLMMYEHNISPVKRAQLYFNLAVINFGAENFHDALKWLNNLLNDVMLDQSGDIHCMARMLNLAVHLELGNTDHLGYSLRSAQRCLQVRNRIYRFESVFLKFINENLKKRPSKNVFRTFISDLETLKDEQFERMAFEYFDFLSWAKKYVDSDKDIAA